MSGILANSSSSSMLAAATSADNSVSGRVTGEQITLTVSPTGTTYQWSLAIPSASTPARSALSSSTGASVTFTPDVAGVWTVVCLVDGSESYTLRITVTSTAVSTLTEAIRQSPKADATVPTPARGMCLYFSDDQETFSGKYESGIVIPLLLGKIGTALTDADATVQVTAGNVWVLPSSTLSANRSMTLGTSGAVANDVLWVIRLDSNAYTLAVINGGAGAGTLVTGASATKFAFKFRFDGTNWSLQERLALNA